MGQVPFGSPGSASARPGHLNRSYSPLLCGQIIGEQINPFCFSRTVEEFSKIIFVVVEMGFGGLSLNINNLKRSTVVLKRSIQTYFHNGFIHMCRRE